MTGVKPEDLLETKEFFRTTIKDIKGEINPLMVSNPKFEELLYNELLFYVRKTGNIDFDIVVSDDKNSVTITSYCPIQECGIKELNDKNRAFMKTIFFLKDTNLVCDYNQGVLFDREELEKQGMRVELSYESKLETFYSTRFFNQYGVEYSNNQYSDVYPFDDFAEDIDLRERVMSSFHKPIFNEYKLASIPIHVMKASVRNTYRKEEYISVIHSNIGIATRDGYKDVNCGLFTCHPLTPEYLRGESVIAKSKGDVVRGFRFEIENDYANSFEEAYSKAQQEFKESIKDLELKDSNSKIYNYLMERL
jgi:hypothetical protein